jgi:hypothetical protein
MLEPAAEKGERSIEHRSNDDPSQVLVGLGFWGKSKVDHFNIN